MLDAWSPDSIAENRRGRLSAEQREQLRARGGASTDELLEGRVVAVAGSVEAPPFEPRREVLPALDADFAVLAREARGLLPGKYWFYVLPLSRVIAGFEARTEPPAPRPLRESPEQVEQYARELLAAQELTPSDLSMLQAGQVPPRCLSSVKRGLRDQVRWLAFALLLSSAGGLAVGLRMDQMQVEFGLGFVFATSFAVWLLAYRILSLLRTLRRPVLMSARGPLRRTVTSRRNAEYYLEVQGSPRVRVPSYAPLGVSVDDQQHRLYWLGTSRHFAALVYEP